MGFIGTLNKIVWKTVPRRWRAALFSRLSIEKRLIWTFDLTDRPKSRVTKPADSIQFSIATPETLREMAEDEGLGMGPWDGAYYARLVQGRNRLVIATIEDTIVFYGGVMFGKRVLPSGYFLLRDDEFFITACFTRSAYRGRGIYPYALRYICDTLTSEGFSLGYMDVATHNEPSIRGAIKAGAKYSSSGYLQIRLLRRDVSIPRGPLSHRFVSSGSSVEHTGTREPR